MHLHHKTIATSMALMLGLLCLSPHAYGNGARFASADSLDPEVLGQPGAIKVVTISRNGATEERAAALPELEFSLQPLIGQPRAQLLISVKSSSEMDALLSGSNADYVVAALSVKNKNVTDPLFSLSDCSENADGYSLTCILNLENNLRFNSPQIVERVKEHLRLGTYTSVATVLRLNLRLRSSQPGTELKTDFVWQKSIRSGRTLPDVIDNARSRLLAYFGNGYVPRRAVSTALSSFILEETFDPCGFLNRQRSLVNDNDDGLKETCTLLKRAPTREAQQTAYLRLREAMMSAIQTKAMLCQAPDHNDCMIREGNDPQIRDGFPINVSLFQKPSSVKYAGEPEAVEVHLALQPTVLE